MSCNYKGGVQARMPEWQLVDEDGSRNDNAGFLYDGEVSENEFRAILV